ncbi:hypothetical protein [Niveispirillum sp. KHB5.9]|uniref:hypothetical protein n=1 Tax=Niveispirillum sp. KHB5.9 TaxID=3400269 RepID=UPI003A846A1F
MEGGSYKRKRGEELKRIGGTEPHPDGSRAREADGTPLNGRVPPPPAAEAEPVPVEAAETAAPGETTNEAATAATTDKGGANKRPPRKQE